MRGHLHLLRVAILALVALLAAPAGADAIPSPGHPQWDEHPPPQPDLPPDRDLQRLAVAAMIGTLLALGSAAAWRSRRVSRTAVRA